MDKNMELMERACDNAAALHGNGCTSLDNWIEWADALLGIAKCHQSLYSKRLLIEDAIHKLETALSQDITNPRTNWCMGNAHLHYGGAFGDFSSARPHFRMASVYFAKAVSLEPDNEKYVESLKIAKEVEIGRLVMNTSHFGHGGLDIIFIAIFFTFIGLANGLSNLFKSRKP